MAQEFMKMVTDKINDIFPDDDDEKKEKKKEKQKEKENDDIWPEDAESDDEKEKEKKNECGLSVRIAPANIIENNIENIVLELCPSDNSGRCAVDICAVLDVSGSMGSSAAVQEDDGTVSNDDGLSVLDLVKHSIKTVIHCLNKNDRLCIVPFDSNASIQYPLSYMTSDGIKNAVIALEKLQPGSATDIWKGLRVGMESLRTKQKINRLSVIMLLTDGRPTTTPQNGYIHQLSKYIDSTNFLPQINTFGFGYNLDSKLLHSLAVHGGAGGTFAFIPDSRIVGTTFVHSISNVLTTISSETKLYLTPMNGAKFIDKPWGEYEINDESWGRIINIGPIMCEGNRYISIPMRIPNNNNNNNDNKPYLECMISTGILGVRGKYNKMTVFGIDRKISNHLLAGHLTAKTVSIGMKACELAIQRNKENQVLKLLKTLKDEIKTATDIANKSDTDNFDEMTANSRIDALNKDVSGRLNKAFQGEIRFNRWGKHYIRSLLRAHQLNICTNFMDPGLQINGGTLFRELRSKGDEAFINLPAPKPSRLQQQQYHHQQQQQQQPTNMNNYYGGAGGGCFGGQCTVNIMMDNHDGHGIIKNKKVSDIKPGDMVQVTGGKTAFDRVIFVVELSRNIQKRMILLPKNGLIITGGHPIRRHGLWCLPREQNDALNINGCNKVFMFILNNPNNIIIVNDIQCITWGHNIYNDNQVLNHSFFGTDKVIKALKQKLINNTVGKRGENENEDLLNNVIAIHAE